MATKTVTKKSKDLFSIDPLSVIGADTKKMKMIKFKAFLFKFGKEKNEEKAKKLLDNIRIAFEDDMIFMTMSLFQIKEINISYSGSGDSGNIEEDENLTEEHKKSVQRIFKELFNISNDKSNSFINYLEKIIIDKSYNVLGCNHCGWEIDEGSQGNITFTCESSQIKIEIAHEWNETITRADPSSSCIPFEDNLKKSDK